MLVLIAAVEDLYAGKKDRKNYQDNSMKYAAFTKESGHSVKTKNRDYKDQIKEGLHEYAGANSGHRKLSR